MTETALEHAQACSLLDTAIEAQRYRLKGYERPSEPLALETVRAIDYVFCRELLLKRKDRGSDLAEARIMSWGVNGALSRIFPHELHAEPFKLFRSNAESQAKADSFLFDCGLLALAERQAEFLQEGLLSATADGRSILVLSANNSSLYGETIGHAGARWASSQTMLCDRDREADLEARHLSLRPAIERQLAAAANGAAAYPSNEIDRHFHEWAELYLRRMPYRDMVDGSDSIGGRKFADYIEVLKALSAMGQMRLCYAGVLKLRKPPSSLRSILTSVAPFDDLLTAVASFLDADTLEVQRLLSHLTLEPANKAFHLQRSDTAWAPVMRTSAGACLLPVYGLEINPFLFLLNDLRWKYEKDWFRIANEREGRWIAELGQLFPTPRWQATGRGIKLRRGSQIVTDIDFAAYDRSTGDMVLCQLKWQQPVAVDHKIRRSTGRNLLDESNRWIAEVRRWIDEFGEDELGRRLGIAVSQTPKVCLFVLARYGAHFSGYGGHDESAVWTDWGHFQKARLENMQASAIELAELIAAEIAKAKAAVRLESLALPLPGLAVVVNPTSVPRHVSLKSRSGSDGMAH